MDRIDQRKKLIEVGAYAKKLRENSLLSRKEFAKKIGIPLTTIENFENGRINNAVLLFQYIEISSQY